MPSTIRREFLPYPGVVRPTSAYAVGLTDGLLLCDTSMGAFTVTLPPSSLFTGRPLTIGLVNGSGALTVLPQLGDYLDTSATSLTMTTLDQFLLLQADGAGHWKILLSGAGITAADLPFPGPGTIGGVESFAPVAHNFLTGISTLGVVEAGEPSFADLSGAAAMAQLPEDATLHGLAFDIQNGGLVLAPGVVFVSPRLPWPGTLVSVAIDSCDGTSGSLTVDIWRGAGSTPTSSASSIVGSGTKPALTGAINVLDTSFAGWVSGGTTFAKNDILILDVTAATSLLYATVTITIAVT
jgi:predicted secreted protein